MIILVHYSVQSVSLAAYHFYLDDLVDGIFLWVHNNPLPSRFFYGKKLKATLILIDI